MGVATADFLPEAQMRCGIYPLRRVDHSNDRVCRAACRAHGWPGCWLLRSWATLEPRSAHVRPADIAVRASSNRSWETCTKVSDTCSSATNNTPPCNTNVTVAGEELHRALQLRSYKQEVIIMVTDLRRLDGFLQAAGSLNQLGLDNILLLSHSKAMCNLITPVVPKIGCAWSTHQHPADLQGNFYMWSLRYRILAR